MPRRQSLMSSAIEHGRQGTVVRHAPEEMTSSANSAEDRVPEIDLLRFCAAAGVAIYHWCYRPVIAGMPSDTAFGFVQAVSRYGYPGVDLFFIISGFVILWSASRRGAASFIASRFSRLYPTFWACVALTAFVLLLTGRAPPSLDLRAFLLNCTMIPGAIGVAYVDGVYWTLFVELKFYLLVFLAGMLLPQCHIER